MTSLLSPRRTRVPAVLKATFARDPTPGGGDPEPLPLGWLVSAIGGAWAAALASWVLTSGLCVLGWLTTDAGQLPDALAVGTQIWLLANGGGAVLGGTAVTLIPWGLTAVVALVIFRFAAIAARGVTASSAMGRQPRTVAVAVVMVAVVMVAAYLVPLSTVALLTGQPWQALRAAAVITPVVGLAAGFAAARSLQWRPTVTWPAWSRALPLAAAAAQLVLVAAGAIALTASLVVHRDRVADLHGALDPGFAGGIALLSVQLALLPNAIIWTSSYALGAGFTLGGSSVVAPAATEVGLLPALPLLGALPDPGPGAPEQLAWLAAGGLAGAVAAWFVVRARPVARPDETALVGGLSGLAAALIFTGLAWASAGDLGADRLASLGPRLLPLLVVGGTTMGLAGTTTGLVLGGVRWFRMRRTSSLR